MVADPDAPTARAGRYRGVLAALAASLMLGACAQVGADDSSGLFSALQPEQTQQSLQDAAPSDPRAGAEYWGKLYAKSPRDLDVALAYAQSLKATGQKREALGVLQQASIVHGSNRKLAADYGRLALELDQISVAKKVLEVADDPSAPDWRVVMARGTALAKEGSYREAIAFYERAQVLNPQHPSVLNNLALAYTMSGEAERGEALLRQASSSGNDNSKVRQNLALVLGLQGKYDEAVKVGSVDLPAEDAQSNTALLKKMVKLDAKAAPGFAGPTEPPSAASWAPAVAEAPVMIERAPSASGPLLRPSAVETGSAASASDNRAASLFSAE